MATAREEAERLVAAALAAATIASRSARRNTGQQDSRNEPDGGRDIFEDLAGVASLATRFLGSGLGGQNAQPAPESPAKHRSIATGSDECCICPVCRAIAAIRDPSPEFAERLASGASDLAAGVTSILRTLGETARRTGAHAVVDSRQAPSRRPEDLPFEEPTVMPVESVPDAAAEGAAMSDAAEASGQDTAGPAGSQWPAWPEFGSVWRAATRVQDEPVAKRSAPDAALPKKAVAKKAVAKKSAPSATEHVGRAGAGAKTPAKKTVVKSAAQTRSTAAKATSAKATSAKKKAAPAKKEAAPAAKKATPRASVPKKAQ